MSESRGGSLARLVCTLPVDDLTSLATYAITRLALIDGMTPAAFLRRAADGLEACGSKGDEECDTIALLCEHAA
jgi:hypothetical protein